MRPIRVLGIDPGTSSLGIGRLAVDPATRTITHIDADTVYSNKEFVNTFLRDGVHGDLDSSGRAEFVMAGVLAALGDWVPDLVAIEEPFMNKRKPGAFKPLYTQVLSFRETVQHQYPNSIILLYSVQECKKSIGASGKSGKETIYDHMIDHCELAPLLPPDHQTLSDHAIDAILIGYTGVLKYLR